MPTAVDVLRSLPADQRDAVRAQMRRAVMPEGTLLIEEGEEDDSLIYVESGNLCVKRQGVAIDYSTSGEILGEMALFGEGVRTASVEVLEETTLLLLDKPGFEVLRSAANPFAFWLEREALGHLAYRLRRLDKVVSELSDGQSSPWVKPPPSVFSRIKSLFSKTAVLGREPFPVDGAQLLYDSPLFQGTTWGFLVEIAERLELRGVEAGHFLCEQGSPGDELYIVARGAVDVLVATGNASGEVRVHKLAQVGPGDAIGLSALADGAPRSASCVAVEPTDVLVLTRAVWDELRAADNLLGSEVRQALIRGFSRALGEAASHVVDLERKRSGRPKAPVMPLTPGPLAEREEAPRGEPELTYTGPVKVFLDPEIGVHSTNPEGEKFVSIEPEEVLAAAAAAELSRE